MDKLRIYLDNCCFNRPYDNQTQMKIMLETQAKLYIQSQIKAGIYELVWSHILDFENSANSFDEKRLAIGSWVNRSAIYCSSSESNFRLAEEIQQKYGLKHKDSIHLACAIETHCDFFITTDIQLIKKNLPNIRTIDPIDFIKEVE